MKDNPRIKPIEQATHRTWNEWLTFLESVDAKQLGHREIVDKVFEQLTGKIESAGWWSQAVAVAYEQEIGRRVPGQRSDGSFETSVSRATKLGMQELMDAWAKFATKDKEVQALIMSDVKVGGTDKRLTWRTKGRDGSAIIVTSEPKANGTASIIAQQGGLQTQELKDEAKEGWAAILSRFISSFNQ